MIVHLVYFLFKEASGNISYSFIFDDEARIVVYLGL